MAEPNKGEYRFSALGVILFGVLLIIVGIIGNAMTSAFGDIMKLLGIGGIVLLIIGIVRSVGERRKQQELHDAAARAIVGGTVEPTSNLTDQLSKLDELRVSGALTEEEFTTAKARLLAQ